MTAYRVVCRDGVADGWSYETLIDPDGVIYVMPLDGPHGFVRVHYERGDPPWPDQQEYRRLHGSDPVDGLEKLTYVAIGQVGT